MRSRSDVYVIASKQLFKKDGILRMRCDGSSIVRLVFKYRKRTRWYHGLAIVGVWKSLSRMGRGPDVISFV
jgi:hypothetical protein